jgi:hypothetical protein
LRVSGAARLRLLLVVTAITVVAAFELLMLMLQARRCVQKWTQGRLLRVDCRLLCSRIRLVNVKRATPDK